MIAPPSILRVASRNDLPFVAFYRRIAYLQRHLANQLFPAFFYQIHYGCRLFRGRQGRQDGHAVAQTEPPKVHLRWAHVPDEVTATSRHEIKHPMGKRIGHHVELVDRRVRILLGLVPVYVIELLRVQPEIVPHVVAQCVEPLHNLLLALTVLLKQG